MGNLAVADRKLYTMHMTKTQAAKLFGSYAAMARALGVGKACVSRWPDQLDQARQDRIMGCALRLGLLKPKSK